MEKQYCYKYPRPELTADCVVFGFDGIDLSVLLIQRKNDPYKGRWALPGGFMNLDETLEECALRELHEETGIIPAFTEQVRTFSSVDRDPRGRVVTVAFYTLIRLKGNAPEAGDDANQARWFRMDELPPLAFDHDDILQTALAKLRETIRQAVDYRLQPDTAFSMPELQRLYEVLSICRHKGNDE